MPRASFRPAPPRPPENPIIWVGSSRADLRSMPAPVREVMGIALRWAQTGGVEPGGMVRLGLHPQARKMKGDLVEVIEIRDDFDGETYRTMYAAKLGTRLYVLHAFQKKARKGIATPRSELDVIRRRLREARTLERDFRATGKESGS